MPNLNIPSNTLGGLSLTVVANETVKALAAKLPFIGAFTTDFSNEISEAGGAVVTRVPTLPYVNDLSVSGDAPQGAISTAKTITLSGYRGAAIAINDKDAASMGIDKFRSTYLNTLVYSVAKDMVDSTISYVASANFPGAFYTGANAAGYDADKTVDAQVTLNTQNAPDDVRTAVLHPSFWGNLSKDNAIQASYAYGNPSAIQDGRVARVHGFDIYSYSDIAKNSVQASEGLRGFFCTPDALLIVNRALPEPANFPGEVVTATEPNSKLTIQVRSFYSPIDRCNVLSASTLWGVAVGNTGALTRMVTGAA